MWRAHFYEKSRIGKWLYKPMATILWVGLLAAAAFNHATNGEIQIWSLSIVLVGFVLFLAAKIQMFKNGEIISFGADVTNSGSLFIALPYVLGYILMVVGFIMSFK